MGWSGATVAFNGSNYLGQEAVLCPSQLFLEEKSIPLLEFLLQL